MQQVVEAWLAAKTPRISPSTVSRYRVALNHIIPALGTMPVARLQARDVEDFYGALYRGGQSGSSIRKVHWAMRQSLAWAKRRGYIATIATDGVELPPLGENRSARPRQRTFGDSLRTRLERSVISARCSR